MNLMPPQQDVFPEELCNVRDWLRWAVSQFNAAGLSYGHGTENAADEAAWLITHTLSLLPSQFDTYLECRLTQTEKQTLWQRLLQRISRRQPTAYLLNEAWLCGLRFYVDERVIVPRSYLAEAILDGMAPWLPQTQPVVRALDLCTGSGCLAILLAQSFPEAHIDAIDISPAALEVAKRNVADYGLEARITLIESDLFAQAPSGQAYDLIICNPPYVTLAAMAQLPPEYRHEPALALAGGADGMDIVRRLMQEAGKWLSADGFLAVEIGHNSAEAEAAFHTLPLIWAGEAHAAKKYFLIAAEDLPKS